MKLLIFLSIILISSSVYANDSNDLLHVTAHFGACYTITHVTEVVCTKVTGSKNKTACTIAAVIVSNAANMAYKANQGLPSDTNRAAISGAAGSAAAAFVINF